MAGAGGDDATSTSRPNETGRIECHRPSEMTTTMTMTMTMTPHLHPHPSISALKWMITFLIFATALLSTVAPLCIINTSESIFSIGNMMTSGVLLAAALTHQLADASSTLDHSDDESEGEGEGEGRQYPWAMLIAGLTFIAFLILEESVHLLVGTSHDHVDGGAVSGGGGLETMARAHAHAHHEHVHNGRDDGRDDGRGRDGTGTSTHNHAHDRTSTGGQQGWRKEPMPQSAPPNLEGTPLLNNRNRKRRSRPIRRLTSCSSASCSASIHHRQEEEEEGRRSDSSIAAIASSSSSSSAARGGRDAGSFRRSYRTYSRTTAAAGAATIATGGGDRFFVDDDDDDSHDEDVLTEMRELDDDAAVGTGIATATADATAPAQAGGRLFNRARTNARASSIMGSMISMRDSIMSYEPTTYSVHHHHDDHITQHLHGSTLASLVLFLALSLHSILEGVAIGIVPNADVVVSTSAAILAHKAFAGYALGSTIITAEGIDTRKHLMMGLAFSITTPLGVLLGLVLLSSFDGDSVAVGVVQAMVAGTFLYVAIVEVGMKELLVCRHDEVDAIDLSRRGGEGGVAATKGGLSIKKLETLKLGFFLLGFLAMSGLAFFV